MHMCAGTRGDNVALYDMRSIQFHSGSGTVLSGDPKLVKIWNAKGSSSSSSARGDEGLGGPPGSIVANVEGTADFLHFVTSGDSNDPSGERNILLLCMGEQPKVQSFYCHVVLVP
ncbi:hypothetical protein ACHAWF_002606 [Thalassiosira exigua]